MSEDKEQIDCCAVITTFNDMDLLKCSLESVLNQEVLPEQIIVVDDGSTVRRDKAYWDVFTIPEYINFKYYYKGNGGPSSARNLGIKLCKQKYISFLDGDDWWFADKLKWQIPLLESKGEGYGAVYGSSVRIENGSKKKTTIMETDNVIDWSRIGKKGGFPGGSAFYTFRSDVLKKIGGYDEKLWSNEDFDLIIRLSNQAKILGRNIPVLNRRVQTLSLSKGKPIKKYLREFEFLFKHSTIEKLGKREVLTRFYLSSCSVILSIFRNLFVQQFKLDSRVSKP